MEKDELEAVSSKLSMRQSLRGIDAQFGFAHHHEAFDRAEIIEAMGEAYERLALGVHDTTQSWGNEESPPLQKVVTPTVYINGEVAGTKTEFLLDRFNFDGQARQPEFVEAYINTRDAVYEELLQEAIATGDIGPLLGVITTYKESTLACRLYNEIQRRKERYPDMIAGDANRVLGRIDNINRRIDAIKGLTGSYAITAAQNELKNHLRKQLNSNDTGLLKATIIGVRAKYFMPRSKSKWVGIVIDERLRKIMLLPSVPEQLIEKEKQGLPLEEI